MLRHTNIPENLRIKKQTKFYDPKIKGMKFIQKEISTHKFWIRSD
jgi:hypothetical protein